MKRMLSICAIAASVCLFGAHPAAAREEGATLMVIPARYTVVQFAFDVARLRPLYLVSYDRPATESGTRLYAWDNGKGEWIPVVEADLRSGSLFQAAPAHVALVGDAKTVPPEVEQALSGFGTPVRITSLRLVDIANGLDKALHFTPREWKWFAGRYGFKLEDRNEERRRWGRYGPPKSKQGVQAPADVVMPSDDIIEPVEPIAPEAVTLPQEAPAVVVPVPVAAAPVVEAAPVAAPVEVPAAAPAERQTLTIPIAENAPPAVVVEPEDK